VSSFGEISPGCGCEREIVDQIVTELKTRMRNRGDTAQIQRAEQTLKRLGVVESKLVRDETVGHRPHFIVFYSLASPQDLIMEHLNIPIEKHMDRT
jgi:hypothetical protein